MPLHNGTAAPIVSKIATLSSGLQWIRGIFVPRRGACAAPAWRKRPPLGANCITHCECLTYAATATQYFQGKPDIWRADKRVAVNGTCAKTKVAWREKVAVEINMSMTT